MRFESCAECEHLHNEVFCDHHKKRINKIRGCSLSVTGKNFFKATSGKEKFRMAFINKRQEEEVS